MKLFKIPQKKMLPKNAPFCQAWKQVILILRVKKRVDLDNISIRYHVQQLHKPFLPLIECEPTDSDECLTITPNWDENRDCAFAKSYCDSWAKDARRCCPQTCGTGLLTKSQCNALDSKGTCIYPAENQCPNRGTQIRFFINQ